MIPLRDSIPSKRFCFVTVCILVLNALAFSYQLSLDPEEMKALFQSFGVVPKLFLDAYPQWQAFVPTLTSQFLHGGWFHILMNLWMLWIFADNVEDVMGRFGFLIFYLVCGMAAALFQIFVSGSSETPMVGASGAISGVMGAYLRYFPYSKILTLIPVFFYPLIFPISAKIYLLYWLAIQIVSGGFALGLSAGAGVAWWAHIGGFIAGYLLSFIFGRKPPAPNARFSF